MNHTVPEAEATLGLAAVDAGDEMACRKQLLDDAGLTELAGGQAGKGQTTRGLSDTRELRRNTVDVGARLGAHGADSPLCIDLDDQPSEHRRALAWPAAAAYTASFRRAVGRRETRQEESSARRTLPPTAFVT